MEQLSTLNASGPIDYENLNIVTHPRPPRRRQSGISLVPFRPYVKCLTSIREPFGYADGKEQWTTTGKNEEFYKQENARCIGTLIDDCDVSDVIRWDIEGESTRLPMVCKLWMIVDGAVVERGKPRLVQDAAVQVYITGRNLRSILAAERRHNPMPMSTFDRRRRQSWHDVNEYHSVPYFQYSRSARLGSQQDIQCDLDNEQVTSIEEHLPPVLEDIVLDNEVDHPEPLTAFETVHPPLILQEPAQVSIMAQTEHRLINQATEIESDFLVLYNLNLQPNESLLSAIVNPYNRTNLSDDIGDTNVFIHRGIKYSNKSVSTGNDYPQWWVQLSTNVLLSNYITNQGEKKVQPVSIPSPRQQLDQSIQTEIEQARSQSPSSIVIHESYEIIDQDNDGNNSRRLLPFQDPIQRIASDSRLSDYQIETTSTRETSGGVRRLRRTTVSSKQSDSDYLTMQQSNSTPDDPTNTQGTSMYSSTNELEQRKRTKSGESTSNSALTTLLERYERTLKERQQAIAIVNNQTFDVDDVLKRYREKVQDISGLAVQSKEDHSLSLRRITKDKYRTMPGITSEEMLEGYIPTPRLFITNTSIDHPRFDYCQLTLPDENSSSAWIRYNEQRIDQLQQRLDLLLQIDDYDDNPLIFSTETVTQCIDDIIARGSKLRNPSISYHKRILLPRRYNFRFPYRSTPSLPSSSRLLTRNVIRSTKSVRTPLRESSKLMSQPIISILRRPSTNFTQRSRRLSETSHIWKDEDENKVYILKQFSIPRYYRLYNDVGFREIYNFSRILDAYVKTQTKSNDYSSIVKNFATQRILPTITSVA